MDEVITPNLASLVCEQVRNFIVTQRATSKPLETDHGISYAPTTKDETSSSDSGNKPQVTEVTIAADLAKLQAAYDRQVLYIIGKEQLKIRVGTGLWRKGLLSIYLWLRENSRTKIANLRIPTERVVEVGFIKDV
jgi:KUP system potassium uptake protein